MKVTCERDELLRAFQMAAGVAPIRSPKPILQNIKLQVTQDRATLLATDLEVGIRIEVPGFGVEAPGAVLLPIQRFGSILRESTDEKLQLESDGARTRVWGERSEFHLPTENPDEFPEVALFQEERYHKLPVRFFRELIRRTIFATDSESSRFALGGVLVEMAAGQIIGVATDGRRLARQDGPAEAVGGHETQDRTIIPARSMQLLERAMTDTEGEVQIAARENDMMVKSERVTLYTRLVEGRFPKWRDVFPRTDQSTAIELTVGPFHSAVRQAGIVTDENHRGVDFSFGDGKAVLLARAAETGESHVEMPIAYDGDTLSVMLDPRYLSDFLKVLEPDTVFTLNIRDSESAVVASTSDGYSYVIMPLARD